MSKNKLFGYWIAVHDEASAGEAVRMSGLPVLLMGANGALLALVAAVQPEADMARITGLGAVAALLVLLAFRIRAGHAGWVPVAVALFLGFLGFSAWWSYRIWRLFGTLQLTQGQILLQWIVPLICLVLAIGGLRGWLWLRAHRRALSF